MNQLKQICTFKLGSHEFGVPAIQVQEIIRTQRVTRVPRAVKTILGLINLRGQLVTAIDTRDLFDFLQHESSDKNVHMNVVVNSVNGLLSLVVDQVGEVVEVSENQYEDLPQTFTGKSSDHLSGVYKLNERLILLLDVDRIFIKGSN